MDTRKEKNWLCIVCKQEFQAICKQLAEDLFNVELVIVFTEYKTHSWARNIIFLPKINKSFLLLINIFLELNHNDSFLRWTLLPIGTLSVKNSLNINQRVR